VWVTAAAIVGVGGTFIETYLWLFSFLGFYAMLGALAVLTTPLMVTIALWRERGKITSEIYRDVREWLKRRRKHS
jgi:hypothetical protein